MKMTRIIGFLCLTLGLVGCASDKGGTSDVYTTGAGSGNQNTYYPYNYQASPPPTFRPGSNPDDIRDANTFARPAPGSPP
jgi:hypothetical protein